MSLKKQVAFEVEPEQVQIIETALRLATATVFPKDVAWDDKERRGFGMVRIAHEFIHGRDSEMRALFLKDANTSLEVPTAENTNPLQGGE